MEVQAATRQPDLLVGGLYKRNTDEIAASSDAIVLGAVFSRPLFLVRQFTAKDWACDGADIALETKFDRTQTNDYFNFCTTTPVAPEEVKREARHKKKKAHLGRSSWPEDGITTDMMYGVIGIVLTLGLVKLPLMGDHWDTSPYHDFVLIRECMKRDMFFLIYSRFFHMASAPSPKRHKDGSQDAGWDALHHIRRVNIKTKMC